MFGWEQHYPFRSVCVVFACVWTVVRPPMFGWEQHYPFRSVCVVFACVWTVVRPPMFGWEQHYPFRSVCVVFACVWTVVRPPMFGWEQHYPFRSVCVVFACVWTVVRPPMFGFLTCTQMLMHAIARGGCTDTVRVCTGSWLGLKYLAALGTQTHISIAPSFLVRHSTNWAIPTKGGLGGGGVQRMCWKKSGTTNSI